MGDTIRSILDFLHRHHFTKAEAALRSEISARQQVTAGFSWPVVDDWDSDDLTLQLSAQEKANLVENGSLDTEMVYMDMELQRLRMKASQEQANLEKKRNGLQWKANNMDVFQAASFLEFEVKEVKGQDNNLGLQQGFQFNKVNASQQKQGMLELVENDLVFSSPKEAQAKMNGDNSVKFTPRVQEVFTASNCSEKVQNFYSGNPDDFCSDVEVKGSPSMVAKDNHGKLGFDSGLEDEGIILIMPDEEMDEIFEIKKLGECQDVQTAEVTHGHVGKQKRHKKVAAVQETVYQEQCLQEYGNCQLEKAVIVQENYGIRGGKFSENKVSDPGLLQLFPEETGGQSGDAFRRSGNGIPIKTCMPFSHSFFHESGFPGLGNLEGQEQQRGNTGKVSQNLARTHPEECLELSNKVRACESSPNGRGDIPKTMEGAVDAEAEVQEIFPRLPPVKLRSCDEVNVMHRDSKGIIMEDQQALTVDAVDPSGDFLGSSVFVDGETTIAGGKRPGVCRRSVSQGISEDTFGLFTGFERSVENSAAECLEDHWESDTYDDDDDPGYHRQPIEDEAWFLAHEIDYPSDDERGKSGMELHPGNHDKEYEEDHTELQFSGEEYYKLMNENVRNVGGEQGHENPNAIFIEDMYERMGSQSQNFGYDESNLDANLMQADQAWQGYTEEETYLEEEGDEKLIHDRDRTEDDSVEVDDERHGSLGIGINSDVADFGSELRENLNGGSSEGDPESFLDHQIDGDYGPSIGRFGQTSSSHDIGEVGIHHDDQEDEHDTILKYYNEAWGHRKWAVSRHEDENNMGKLTNGENGIAQRNEVGGFSFPSPSSTADLAGSRADSTKDVQSEDIDEFAHGPDDTLAFWKRKSNHSSPLDPRDTENSCLPPSCFPSLHEKREEEGNEEDGMIRNQEATEATAVEDEEMAAMQEHIRRFQSDEEEFETFNLRVVHRKNRTGFEEDKEFPVVINSIIAGRYHVTEYLGSAAFSRAIQAHDLNTGMDVCMKIIKNNKDFFDQSLDEIKLLKYINRHDPADKHHLLRLYDYFYHREHLFIVCELLRANLYEFHKYNRESGGEVYFTMPRLQSITRQCLEALDFLHGLGLMHCDLKPENILVKSYSRCEIKVIDLGSSCFQTDHLCSYVQSRSYRAPEVILGLSYDQKIDIWSLGCILAELCTGNVLFQNDSLASLLARVIGIIGPIDPEMLAKGRDSYKYFTKNHMLYERNPETDQLEYLIPKKTTLAHRLPMGDEGFVEFVAYLLQINPVNRPSAAEALQHPWLSYPYEPISS